MKPLKPTQKRLPLPQGGNEITEWKGKMELTAHRYFSFWDRCKIFLGYEIDISVTILTQHFPGKYAPEVKAELTELTQSRDLVPVAKMRAAIKPRWGKVPVIPPSATQYGFNPPPSTADEK